MFFPTLFFFISKKLHERSNQLIYIYIHDFFLQFLYLSFSNLCFLSWYGLILLYLLIVYHITSSSDNSSSTVFHYFFFGVLLIKFFRHLLAKRFCLGSFSLIWNFKRTSLEKLVTKKKKKRTFCYLFKFCNIDYNSHKLMYETRNLFVIYIYIFVTAKYYWIIVIQETSNSWKVLKILMILEN